MSERTVTLSTLDHGEVVLAEPAWCIGHDDHQAGFRADILHRGTEVTLNYRGRRLASARLSQAPYAELGTRTPGVGVAELAADCNPTELYDLAAVLDGYADRLRDLADHLDRVLAGGED